MAPIYLYKCIVCSFSIDTSIKKPSKICDTTISVNVLDTPSPGIAFTVKYIINPPNIPPNNNLGFIDQTFVNDFMSPVNIILIKKNIEPTPKLINVALNADVLFPNSPFINASSAVDPPASIANTIDASFVNLLPPFVFIY